MTQPATLIYDGDCSLCCRATDWVLQHAIPGALAAIPCGSPEHVQRFPFVSETACREAIHIVLNDGSTYSADAALPHILRYVRGWRWMTWIFHIPGIRWISPYAYRWIARHRYELSLLVARKHSRNQ